MKNVIIWGVGAKGEYTYNEIKYYNRYSVIAFADNDVNKIGHIFMGLTVLSAKEVQEIPVDAIVIASTYSTEIKRQLSQITTAEVYENVDLLIKKCIIDISGWCNSKCKYCITGIYNRNGQCNREYMDYGLFKKIYEHLEKIGLKFDEIQLYNWGEPFLNPDYVKIISYLSEKKQIWSVSTNASIIKNIDDNSAVYKYCKTITFSISGFTQKSYGYIHGLDLNIILQNIKKIYENAKESGFSGQANMAYHVYKFNIDEVEDARNYCKDNGLNFLPYYAYLAYSKYAYGYLENNLDNKENIDSELYLDYVKDLLKNYNKMECQLINTMTLDHTGRIELCSMTDKECGDYYWGKIFDINSVEEWNEYRLRMLNSCTCNKCINLGWNYWVFNQPSFKENTNE